MPPGISAFRSAKHGTASIVYYSNIEKTITSRKLFLELKTKPWRSHEFPPISWEFLPPGAASKYAKLKLAVSRDTEISIPLMSVEILNEGSILRQQIRHIQFNTEIIELHIIRTQYSNKRIPSLGDAISPFNMHPIETVAPPRAQLSLYRIGNTSRTNRSRLDEKIVTVIHAPILNDQIFKKTTATYITQNAGKYGVRISIKNPLLPAKYWYGIVNPVKNRQRLYFLVAHDNNVAVKSTRSRIGSGVFDGPETIEVRTVTYEIKDRNNFKIPYLDEKYLDENKYVTLSEIFQEKIDKGKWLKNHQPDGEFKRQLVNKIEDVISVIPIADELYDIGTLAYTLATGKRAWLGDDVSRSEMIVFAALVLLPLLPEANKVLKKIRPIDNKKLRSMVDKIIKEDAAETISFEVIAAMSTLSTQEQKKLAESLKSVFK